jgi:hypothetical protein
LFSLLAATAWAADGAARAAQLENAAAFVKVTGVGEDNKPRA